MVFFLHRYLATLRKLKLRALCVCAALYTYFLALEKLASMTQVKVGYGHDVRIKNPSVKSMVDNDTRHIAKLLRQWYCLVK